MKPYAVFLAQCQQILSVGAVSKILGWGFIPHKTLNEMAWQGSNDKSGWYPVNKTLQNFLGFRSSGIPVPSRENPMLLLLATSSLPHAPTYPFLPNSTPSPWPSAKKLPSSRIICRMVLELLFACSKCSEWVKNDVYI